MEVMKMKKLVPLFVLLFISISLTACGGDDPAQETNPVTPSATPITPSTPEPSPITPEVVPDPIDLVFYYVSPQDWTEETFMRTFGDPIKQKYPYITPKFRNNVRGSSLEELIAAQEQVDVVFTSTGLSSRFTNVNMQFDITPLLKEANYDESIIDAETLNAGKIIADGGLYGLPVYTVPATMYYNKDIFEKFGVDYPKDGLTWNDMHDIAARLTRMDGDEKYYGFRTSIGHLTQRNQFSLNLLSPTTNRADFSNDQWKDFFDSITRFYQFSGVPTDIADLNFNKQREAFFIDKKAAMWLALTNLHTTPELDNSFNWDLATFPSFPGAEHVGPQPYPVYFYIASTSKHRTEAFNAIAHLTTKEYQLKKSQEGQLLTILNDPEVRKAFGQEDSLYKGKNVSALLPKSYTAPANISKHDSMIRGELEKAIFSVIVSEKDINTALRDAQEEANSKIEIAESS